MVQLLPAVNLTIRRCRTVVPHIKTCAGLGVLLVMATSPARAQIQQFQTRALQEPREGSRKLDILFRTSEWYLGFGTALDMISTVRVLNHPTVALGTDQSVIGRFSGVENGWAGSVVGRRNTAAVVSANVILNVSIGMLSRNLYRRGGHWRFLAIGLNVLKGTNNTMAGIGNLRFNAGIDGQLRAATGYRGQIAWSH